MPNNLRIDDLQTGGLRLVQNPSFYCFNSDSVVLANLCKVSPKMKIAELGAGSGVISILLAGKRGATKVVAVEKQAEMFELLKKNVKLNSLENKIETVHSDINDFEKWAKPQSFDMVVVNPPYETANGIDSVIDNCRTENLGTLEDFVSVAAKLLSFGKEFYVIGKIKRMAQTIALAAKYGLESKELTLIYPKRSKCADTFMLKAVKGGKVGLTLKTLVEMDEDGEPTEEFKELYR